ncbi:piggyBac transposable element-derived protein 2-like [Nerophis ophidion]|uniref:piggyBac transposable element-derived protein 2-like n=1 Tax=Nerophis ophidion TaxID=159077 RepID=UPI002ADFBF5A|nr:piggyBac transposable element-derived protein 2-like [Nerophis ophidion]
MLKELVKKRLMVAADEIFALFERTIASYEEELCRTREEKEQHRQQLEAVYKSRYVLHTEDVQQLIGCPEVHPPQPKEGSSDLDQEDPQPRQIKEEEEELWTTQEREFLLGQEEANLTKLQLTGVSVKTEYYEDKPPESSPFHHSPSVENRGAKPPSGSSPPPMTTEVDGDHCGGPQADNPSAPLSDSDDTTSYLHINEMANKYCIEDALKRIMDGSSSDMEQLGEEDDEMDEWTPPERTEESTDTSDDEEVPEVSDEDTTEYNDTTQKQATPGKMTRKEYQWKRKRFEPPAVDFVEYVEEGSEDRLDWTPYSYFKDFVTEEMLLEIAEETNLYGLQKDGKSVNTNAKEIEQVVGMYMHMGLVQMPNVRAYWEMETRYPAVCDVMSRDRFLYLLPRIHFQNNLRVSEEAKKDKLWKLSPWLEKLRQRFLCMPPEECHAVDKIMVPFKRKVNLRRCVPGNDPKSEFTMWGRVGLSGFLYDFDVRQGEENPDQEKSDVDAAVDVVLKMTSTLPANKNHKVFADKYFTSVQLVEHLQQRGIYFIGTVRTSRVKNCILVDEKELKAKGRGSLDFSVNQEDHIIVRWYDNKPVDLLSSFVGVEPLGHVKRWDRKAQTHIMVPRPAIVEAYGKFMAGVDLLDMLSALYRYRFRSQRWYLDIWWDTVTVAVINAWIRYRKDLGKMRPEQKPLPLQRFQASVGTSLTSAGKVTKFSRPLSSPDATPTPSRKRKTTGVPPDVRKDALDHFPTWQSRQRCKYCTGHFSHVYCEKCKVHLCLNNHRNCFQAYHHAN